MPQLSCAAAEETGYPGSLMICVTSSVGFSRLWALLLRSPTVLPRNRFLKLLLPMNPDRQRPSCCLRPIPPIPRVLPIRGHTPII